MDSNLAVVLLPLNIFHSFSGRCMESNCYSDELYLKKSADLFLRSAFNEVVSMRQDNCPNLHELSQYYVLQKYISIPL